MDTKNIVQELKTCARSKTFKIIVSVVGVLLVVSFIFQAGVFVGFHKANFSRGWGDNYNKTFGQPQRGGMMGGFEEQGGKQDGRGVWGMMGLSEANGVAGKIVSVNLPTLVVSGQDGVEKVVLMKDDTVVRNLRDTVASSTLSVDTYIVVFGTPNAQSQIEAKLIRIMPANAPTSMMNINNKIQ